ncbi:MAG: non-ribosomal peptide synthetase, partial [Chloroflexi bacterium]
PDPARLNRTLPRLQALVADARATVALTTTPILTMAQFLFDQAPDLKALRWVATDSLEEELADRWQEPDVDRNTLAFLQYTSGSTRTPRGVMLTHDNLLHNSALIVRAMGITPDDSVVSWLPPYHDMGLIGAILQPLYVGIPCTLMSPIAFLQRPFRWLQAISRYRATISGGPNFAYDLCVRKVTPEQRAGLDLSRWTLAFNGAEPVRWQTLKQFAETFESCGFRWRTFYPCYGLAEATLMVSGGRRTDPPVFCTVRKEALERDRVVEASDDGEESQTLVGSGQPGEGHQVVIVDPQSRTRCPPDRIGEVWVAGPSVAQGYWNRPEETEQTFHAYLADTGEGPFLRTGDLGFLKDGELFITGRLKDLIIIRGRNHYPQDIELTVEQSHPALRRGCGAAFSVEVAGEERLVVVQEVYTHKPWDWNEVAATIRRAVAEAHQVQVYAVVLIEPRTIPKTSSGKIQRRACRTMYLSGTLDVVAASVLDEAPPRPGPTPVEERPPESLLVKALRAMAPEQRQALLESHLQEQVARVLRLSPSQVDPQQPLVNLGLDSVMVVDLASELESGLGVTLDLETLFQEITLSQLAALVLTELTAPSAPPSPPSAPAPEIVAEYPLSDGQRALWFLQQVAPESAAYNLVHAARVPTPLDV